jgi:hypothetical protein
MVEEIDQVRSQVACSQGSIWEKKAASSHSAVFYTKSLMSELPFFKDVRRPPNGWGDDGVTLWVSRAAGK